MTKTQHQETSLRIGTSGSAESVSLTLDAGNPVTVRLELSGGCPCGGTHDRSGSYVTSDLGAR
ncbi:hypothetical protein ACFRJ9_12390 [Paenarthrobacter sp. NPDC056912]|uniref:hypothetical protein n=1 Tax=Paenarthrobacter sp. NPDC056912 TaxID=3345965 RepID=UPI00366D25B0